MDIRTKIFLSFLIVMMLLMASVVSVFFFHVTSLTEYKNVSDNLVHENQLSQKTSELVETFNGVLLAPASTERMHTYRTVRQEVVVIMEQLDSSITNTDSQVAYAGFSKIVREIIAHADAGLSALEQGDTNTAIAHYTDALYKKGFISEVATNLLLTEVQHLQDIQSVIESRYARQLLLLGAWTGFVLLLAAGYSFVFARRITAPIMVLSRVSKEVSGGEYEKRIPKTLVAREDEVGVLAGAFNLMLETLNIRLRQVEHANTTISKTKKDLEERNAELERFNRMVVNRELKMVALKQENERLRSELEQR